MPNVTVNVPAGYAYFVTLVPNAAVADLVKALARHKGVPVPTDPVEMQALAAEFTRDELFRIYVDYKAQEAAQNARDAAANW